MKKKNPDKFELLKDVYFQLFPDIEDIIVENIQIDSVGDEQFPEDVPFIFTNSIYVLFVRDKNLVKPVNFSTMSDGAKRVFMILNPSWIHVGVNREPGMAEFFVLKKSGQKQLEKDADSFNMSIGDYLFSLLSDAESPISDYLECDVDE